MVNPKISESVKVDRPLKMYWIYSADGWFLGGGPCPAGEEKLAEEHLKFCQQNNKGAYITWDEITYTYVESYFRAFNKTTEIQKSQPGIRENWTGKHAVRMHKAIAKITKRSDIEEIQMIGARQLLGMEE